MPERTNAVEAAYSMTEVRGSMLRKKFQCVLFGFFLIRQYIITATFRVMTTFIWFCV